jgi:hypothetical protein
MRKGGARPNRYRVIGAFPSFAGSSDETRSLSFLCKAASLPASTLGVAPAFFRGREIKLPGDRTFEEWTVTIYNSENFKLRDAFEKWSNAINAHEENIALNLDEIEVDFDVQQLSRTDEVIKTVKMVSIFPTLVGPIELAYDNNDTVEEFEVTFAVQYWTSNTTS